MTAGDWRAGAEAVIADCILEQRTVTYAGLADAAGIPSPHRIHKLAEWLETLMEEDHALGLPPRAAVVVSKMDGLPARGFFEKLEGLVGVGYPQAACRASLHAALLEKLWGAPRRA